MRIQKHGGKTYFIVNKDWKVNVSLCYIIVDRNCVQESSPLFPELQVSFFWLPRHSLSSPPLSHVDLCGNWTCVWAYFWATPATTAITRDKGPSPFFDLAPIFSLDGHFTWVLVSLITCEGADNRRNSVVIVCHTHNASLRHQQHKDSFEIQRPQLSPP